MLPKEFEEISASSEEYILPFAKSLEAIEILRRENVACLGWELILSYPDGNIGHPDVVIGYAAEINNNEAYDDFVERASWDCKSAIEKTVKEEKERYEEKGISLLFCITPDYET